MAKKTTKSHQLPQSLLTVIASVAILYFGRDLFIPWSMAVLLTFLLTPLVKILERRKLPRIPAVVLSMLVVFGVLIIAGGIVESQLSDLANKLPQYRENMRAKIDGLTFSPGAMKKVEEVLRDVDQKLAVKKDSIQVVRVAPESPTPRDELAVVVTSVIGPIANTGIVLVLVVFMLIQREDLRNRLVRLAGTRLALTTRTLDEIGSRISKYLLLNALVNGAFGICVAIGLSIIGVDYSIMWGFLAGALRFLPYIGPVLGSLMPIAMAFIQFPAHDWTPLILTGALFAVLELITNNVIEPIAYGPTMGVSTVAILVTAMFWTWIWGPLGLLLAVPLTVVVVVLGEHIKALEIFAILLGDKSPLASHITYYQRLLAGDTDEAYEVFEVEAKAVGRMNAFDNVVVPALVLADLDQRTGELLPEEQQAIWQSSRDCIDDIFVSKELERKGDQSLPQPHLRVHVVGCPAEDFADELALTMLQRTLIAEGNGRFEVLPVTMLVSEMIAHIEKVRPDVVCVSLVGASELKQSRYFCIRLRQKFPDIRIMVGQWGYLRDRERMTAALVKRGATNVVTTLTESCDQLDRIMPVTLPLTLPVTVPVTVQSAA